MSKETASVDDHDLQELASKFAPHREVKLPAFVTRLLKKGDKIRIPGWGDEKFTVREFKPLRPDQIFKETPVQTVVLEERVPFYLDRWLSARPQSEY